MVLVLLITSLILIMFLVFLELNQLNKRTKRQIEIMESIFHSVNYTRAFTQNIERKLFDTMLPVAVDVQSIEYALYDVAKFEKQQMKRRNRKIKRNM